MSSSSGTNSCIAVSHGVKGTVMGHRLEVSVSACRKPDSYKDLSFRKSQHRTATSLDDKLVTQPSDEKVKRIMLVSFSSVWHLPERNSLEERKIHVVSQFQPGANCICCFRSELRGTSWWWEHAVEEAAHSSSTGSRDRERSQDTICPYKTCSQKPMSSNEVPCSIVPIASQ